jgi:hypothetical protein
MISMQDMLDDAAGIAASLESHFARELASDLEYHGFDSVDSVDDEKLLRHFSYLQRKLEAVSKLQRKLQRIDAILSNSIE